MLYCKLFVHLIPPFIKVIVKKVLIYEALKMLLTASAFPQSQLNCVLFHMHG